MDRDELRLRFDEVRLEFQAKLVSFAAKLDTSASRLVAAVDLGNLVIAQEMKRSSQ